MQTALSPHSGKTDSVPFSMILTFLQHLGELTLRDTICTAVHVLRIFFSDRLTSVEQQTNFTRSVAALTVCFPLLQDILE